MSKIKGGQNVIPPIYSGYRRHRRNPEQILIREEKYRERENYENNEDESTYKYMKEKCNEKKY